MARSTFALWRFSMRMYRAPRVARACLALQDHSGADVNLLLYCCWTGRGGRRLDGRALRAAMRAVATWQSGVVKPLRLARRALGRGKRPPGEKFAQRLRKRIGAAELDAEYAEQCMLARCAARLPQLARRVEPRAAGEASLERYLDLLGVMPGPREARDLATLIDACFPRPTSAPGR